MTEEQRAAGELWCWMEAKVRILTDHRVEIYHETDADTGEELGRMVLPRQAVWAMEADLLRAIATRETIRVEVDLAEILKAKREME